MCSLCELVEACTTQIRSGWRPLFAALRAVRIKYTTSEEVNEARQRHVTAVLDVFDVFLDTENALVFANAAVDCIQCLHKYVRGQGTPCKRCVRSCVNSWVLSTCIIMQCHFRFQRMRRRFF